jgi:hypothetical protein
MKLRVNTWVRNVIDGEAELLASFGIIALKKQTRHFIIYSLARQLTVLPGDIMVDLVCSCRHELLGYKRNHAFQNLICRCGEIDFEAETFMDLLHRKRIFLRGIQIKPLISISQFYTNSTKPLFFGFGRILSE